MRNIKKLLCMLLALPTLGMISTGRVKAQTSTSDSLTNGNVVNQSIATVKASDGLVLLTNGNGTIQHGAWPKSLVIGNNYTVKAVPKQNNAFSNWVASGSQSFVSDTASLTFTMNSGLVLQASFASNPFPHFAGVYEGLCMNASNVTMESSGSFKATVGDKGTFSANLVLAGQSHSFSGQFSAGGFTSNLVAPNSAALTVLLQLDLTGNNIVTGTVSNSGWLSDISAYRIGLYSPATAEKYTVVIPGNTGSTTEPGGNGFGSLTVSTAGSATFSGMLADNTSVSETASVSQGGLWPFYASLYSGKGMIIGWLALTNETDSDINGGLTWIKGQVKAAKYYASGFTTQPQAIGSLYARSLPLLNSTNPIFYLTGGDIIDDLTNGITLSGTQISSTNKTLKLTFTSATGKFQGTVKTPVTGNSPATLSFKGVILQKQNVALGFYLGADQSGIAGFGSNTISIGSIPTFTLTLGTTGSGSGTVFANPPGPTYVSGTVVTLTATPASGSTFTGWSGDATGSGTNVQITMDTNKSAIANFDLLSPAAFTLTLGTAGSGSGTVSATVSGTVVTLTATPASGSTFTGWSGDATGTGTSVQIIMDTNKSAIANFDLLSPATFTLTLGTAGSGSGTVSANPSGPTYVSGTLVTLTATPASGSTFTGWSGDATGTGTNIQITMDTNQLVTATFNLTPVGMALIPAGPFLMGDSVDGESDSPTSTVTVSAFYMDTNLVSYTFWQQIYQWAATNGYSFDDAGSGIGTNYPVQTVDWYDVVRWCNARSQMAGLTPVYYTDAGLTQVYKTGDVAVYANWTVSGYRLPTEAEWEKAARGGAGQLRFPWGNTISESQANYYGDPYDGTFGYTYDEGPAGPNATFDTGLANYFAGYTSPVGYFAPNGYGLNDMTGNVFEWCWDWYGPYATGPQTDPHGATSGTNRVERGGCWVHFANECRTAFRNTQDPTFADNELGFRAVLPHSP